MPKYLIRLNAKTVVEVNQEMLYTRSRWLDYFGTFDKINEFIDNYNKNGRKSS